MFKRQFGYSVFKRYASVKTSIQSKQNEDISLKSKSHIYNKKLFTTHTELAENLAKDCIYNENGVIVLNKPYGLKKEQKENQNDTQIIRHPSVSNMDHLSFTGALPSLKENLSVDQLNLVKLPERYISGVSIITSKEISTKQIVNCLRNLTIKPYTYLALCIGIPKLEENIVKLGITLSTKQNTKKVIFLETYSTNASKMRQVFPLYMHHRVLSKNEELKVSLVELSVNRNKWHCLRLYCATNLLSPCLGDWLMGPRVRYINDMPVLTDPFNPVTNSGQILPDRIIDALQIKKHDQNSIPLHMHLARLDFPQHGKNGKIFIAKPPEHFLWSCQKLGISVPDYYSQNSYSPYRESDDVKNDDICTISTQ